MNSLANQIIDKLLKEKDSQLLAQVLDFYEYIKLKKEQREQKSMWEIIAEDEPTKEERDVLSQYEQDDKQMTDFNSLVQELIDIGNRGQIYNKY